MRSDQSYEIEVIGFVEIQKSDGVQRTLTWVKYNVWHETKTYFFMQYQIQKSLSKALDW